MTMAPKSLMRAHARTMVFSSNQFLGSPVSVMERTWACTTPPRSHSRSLRLAGQDVVAAALGLAHHRKGGVLVNLERFQGVANEKYFHGD
jgi:hypothetical protein